MFQKIKDLCKKMQQNQRERQRLRVKDNLAANIFGQTSSDHFILSDQQPKTKYGVEIDNDTNYIHEKGYKDSQLPGFEKLGPNEKYIVHKIFNSPNRLVCVVGGIGVGKTSFSLYLTKELIPKVFHCNEEESHHCPGIVYFNFNAYNNVAFPKTTIEIAEKSFVKLLGLSIKDSLVRGKFFSITEQVGVVWNDLLRDSSYDKNNNTAISELRSRLDEEELDEDRFQQKPDEVVGLRRSIRKQIIESEHSLDYFAALLNYVKNKYYKIKTPCLFIIIDNVDREPPEIQRIVEKIVRSLTEKCEVKVIFNVRQTTYHQGSIDKYSKAVDRVPYDGTIPLEVVYSRIDNFVNKQSIYLKCLVEYEAETVEILRVKLNYIKETFLKSDRFVKFFNSLCGGSVRKGLLVAQALVFNSVYNIMEINTEDKSITNKELRMGNIIQALLVRTRTMFEYRSDEVVENLFQTQKEKNKSHLIKIRILKAVANVGDNGMKIVKLVEALRDFEYSERLIVDSLMICF